MNTRKKHWSVFPVETRNYGWSEVVESVALCHKLGVKRSLGFSISYAIVAFRTSCSPYLHITYYVFVCCSLAPDN